MKSVGSSCEGQRLLRVVGDPVRIMKNAVTRYGSNV